MDIGRNKVIDTLIDEWDLLTSMIAGKSIDVKHYYGIVDEAIKNANFVITSDNNCGNQIFKTLALVCGVKSFGAVTLEWMKYTLTHHDPNQKQYILEL